MSENTTEQALNKKVAFIQHELPGMQAGQYKLSVKQQLTTTEEEISEEVTSNYEFAVLGERFKLVKPKQSIYSVFPPEDAAGKYNAVLPHVVFTNTSFPWSRAVGNVSNKPKGPNQTDEDVPTWLTVLLFDEDDEDDENAYQSFSLETKQVTIADLMPNGKTENSLKDNYSYFQKSPLLAPGEQPTEKIDVLDIPLALFQKIAPTVEDLKVMAHVRKVSLLKKVTMPGISDIGEPTGSFSIVFGNRLPQELKKTKAYLVSLEGLAEFLPESKTGKFDKNKFLRLAVLKSWSFSSNGQSATFTDRLLNLDGAISTASKDESNNNKSVATHLCFPSSEQSISIVKQALSMGYIPLNHELRSAEKKEDKITVNQTVSWYRGPCIPYKVEGASIKLPISSPDEVTIFDPTTGMLDTSYATAWSLGRLLALQDKAFSTGLYNWKKGLRQDIIKNAEKQVLAQRIMESRNQGTKPKAKKKARKRGIAAPKKEELELDSLKEDIDSNYLMLDAIFLAMNK